jgi:hypothetical protein
VRLFTRTPTIDHTSAADLLAARTVVVVDVRRHAENFVNPQHGVGAESWDRVDVERDFRKP